MVFKLVISDPKSGKAFQTTLEKTNLLIGKKIGEKVSGEIASLSGYELEITGGSDKIGNPMRKDLEGAPRRLLLSKGTGFRAKEKGERRKKRVAGNAVSADIVQINMKVVKYGEASLDKIFPSKEKPAVSKAHSAEPAAEKEAK